MRVDTANVDALLSSTSTTLPWWSVSYLWSHSGWSSGCRRESW